MVYGVATRVRRRCAQGRTMRVPAATSWKPRPSREVSTAGTTRQSSSGADEDLQRERARPHLPHLHAEQPVPQRRPGERHEQEVLEGEDPDGHESGRSPGRGVDAQQHHHDELGEHPVHEQGAESAQEGGRLWGTRGARGAIGGRGRHPGIGGCGVDGRWHHDTVCRVLADPVADQPGRSHPPVDGQRRASPVPPSSACRAGHLTYRYGGLRYTGETHGSRSVNRFSLESSRSPRAGSS